MALSTFHANKSSHQGQFQATSVDTTYCEGGNSQSGNNIPEYFYHTVKQM